MGWRRFFSSVRIGHQRSPMGPPKLPDTLEDGRQPEAAVCEADAFVRLLRGGAVKGKGRVYGRVLGRRTKLHPCALCKRTLTFDQFRILDQSELLEGTTFGISFTAVTIFAPTHCKHLKSLLTQEYGVRFERKRLPSLSSAFELYPSAKIVFNCVGGAAETFPGVKDTKCFPTRGQILIAHAPKVSCCMARHGRDYGTYVIPRPNSGGQVVLGGYQQKHISTGDTFGGETDSIRERTGRLLPALLDDDVHIMAQLAGLRPSREGGARVEREEVGSGRAVIHNYGAGGTGYQAGIAMSIDAVNLADSDLTSKR